MGNYITNSKVLLEAKVTLEELAINTLNWIPGHEGHREMNCIQTSQKRGQ